MCCDRRYLMNMVNVSSPSTPVPLPRSVCQQWFGNLVKCFVPFSLTENWMFLKALPYNLKVVNSLMKLKSTFLGPQEARQYNTFSEDMWINYIVTYTWYTWDIEVWRLVFTARFMLFLQLVSKTEYPPLSFIGYNQVTYFKILLLPKEADEWLFWLA